MKRHAPHRAPASTGLVRSSLGLLRGALTIVALSGWSAESWAYATHDSQAGGVSVNSTLAEIYASIDAWLDEPDPATCASAAYGIGAHVWLTYKAVSLFESFYGIPLARDEVQAILEGSVEEDFAATGTQDWNYLHPTANLDYALPAHPWDYTNLYYRRAENHFMAPPTWSKLTDGGLLLRAPTDAATWATTDSRNNVRYEVALLDARNNRLQAFRELGHALHLLEDMTVPAHVRNDAHVFDDDNYEANMHMTPDAFDRLFRLECAEGASCEPIEVELNLIGAPSVTERASALRQMYEEISAFTAGHFYSDDTIMGTSQAGVALAEVNDYVDGDYLRDADLETHPRIAHIMGCELGFCAYNIDAGVTDDEFAILGARAVRYGAGLIQRFYLDAVRQCVDSAAHCGEAVALTPGTLYRCSGGRFQVVQACASGCEQRLPGADDRCAPSPPTVVIAPNPGHLEACVDQSGSGFPPNTRVELVFQDFTAGLISRSSHITTDAQGRYPWFFGLDCPEPYKADAAARATAAIGRVDPDHIGFVGRSMRYWAEFSDGGTRGSNVVDFLLDYAGNCQPTCAGKVCGSNGCGTGSCGACPSTQYCVAGACVASAAPRMQVCGQLNSATWRKADSPVLVTCDVNVSGTLTIEAGVVVQFKDETDLNLLTGASLLAVGTQAEPIVFTSDGETTAEAWGGIYAASGATLTIRQAEFRYGGRSYNGNGYPLQVHGNATHTLSELRFDGNRVNGVALQSGSYSRDVHLTAAGIPYWIPQDVTIEQGVTLTVDPGAILKFGPESDLFVYGRLEARGTEAQPIYFTSAKDDVLGNDTNADGRTAPAAGNWGGVVLYPNAVQLPSVLEKVEIRYGGATWNATGYALRVDGTLQPSITSTNLVGNRINAISLVTGAYSQNLRLNVVGLPYWIASDLTVNQGVTMTVDPGVILRFAAEADLLVQGRLVSQGTAAQSIWYTSYRDDAHGGDANGDGVSGPQAGDWGGIVLYVNATQPPSALSNVEIRYGGATWNAAGYPLSLTGPLLPTIAGTRLVSNRINGIGLATGSYGANLRLNVVGLPYWINADLTVNAGVTMTVDPGVVLKFAPEADLIVTGQLVAAGTLDKPIYFTSIKDDALLGDTNADGSTAPAAGNWGGIGFRKSAGQAQSRLTNVEIRYGGATWNAEGYPIGMDGRLQPDIRSTLLVANRLNGIGLVSGAYAENLRLNVTGLAYWIPSDLTVNAGVTMTIDPGVVLKFTAETDIFVQGRLQAVGTPTSPIVFTSTLDDSVAGDTNGDGSTAPAAGNWGGISFSPNEQPASTLSNVEVRYGGATWNAEGYPLRVNARTQPSITSSRLLANRINGIGLVTGAYASNLRLNVVGLPYWVGSDLTVNQGVTMTVDPGVVVKFASETDLLVSGTLWVDGTAASPVTFTSARDDTRGGDTNADGSTSPAAEDWGGVDLAVGSTGSTIRHCVFAYGGSSSRAVGCALTVEGTGLVEAARFEQNDDAVCLSGSGTLDLGGGLLGSAGGSLFLGHVPGSGNWTVYNDTGNDVFALGNWWGAADAASIDGTIFDRKDNAAKGLVHYDSPLSCLEGALCNDGDACTVRDVCQSGRCAGERFACESPGICETALGATCNGDGTCSYRANTGGACDDGNPCTSGDQCRADRSCRGTSYACDSPPACFTVAGAQCHGDGTCTYQPLAAGSPCGSQLGTVCTRPDTCDGRGVCQANHEPASTVCRPAISECDAPERCTGTGLCPGDAFLPVGALCGDPGETLCSRPDSCDGAGICSSNNQAAGSLCRPAAGPCDRPEYCDEAGSCPPNALQAVGTPCGDASDTACSAPDRCDGHGTCDPAHRPLTTVCRLAGGECDLEERCDGAGSCAPDQFRAAGEACGDPTDTPCSAPDRCDGRGTCDPAHRTIEQVCRPAAGECDAAEGCDGHGQCPPDRLADRGTPCGLQAESACSHADSCDGNGGCLDNDEPPTRSCRSAATDCDVEEFCNGLGDCPADQQKEEGAACGDHSTTACGRPDTCNGQGFCLPNNLIKGMICRDSRGQCDLEERCDDEGACPADRTVPAGTPCGDASAHACSAPDTCDDSGRCNANDLVQGLICRPALGDCDLPELCSGLGPDCPPDRLLDRGAICRPAFGGCDQAESCDGLSAAYPVDRALPPGSVCRVAGCLGDSFAQEARCDGVDTRCPSEEVNCAPYRCQAAGCKTSCLTANDCAAGNACLTGQCTPLLSDGKPCDTGGACSSGFCTDGYCCDGACNGQCAACDMEGALGVCTPVQGVPHGERPACSGGDGLCRGYCDGTNGDFCAYPGGETPCRVNGCEQGVAMLAAACDGAGFCPRPQAVDCAPYDCAGGHCAGDCALDADCLPGHFCAAGVCVPLLSQGDECAAENQCTSGFCVDGRCCEDACTAQCTACDVVGWEGYCTELDEEAPHGARTPCPGLPPCRGLCRAGTPDACTFPGEEQGCALGNCVDGWESSPTTCDGRGGCLQAPERACSPYTCQGERCSTACTESSECAEGFACRSGACVAGEAPDAGAGGDGGADLGTELLDAGQRDVAEQERDALVAPPDLAARTEDSGAVAPDVANISLDSSQPVDAIEGDVTTDFSHAGCACRTTGRANATVAPPALVLLLFALVMLRRR